jgi:pyruvate dehydrogenase E1 component alpha subunit
MRQYLLDNKLYTEKELEAMEKQTTEDIENAVRFAEDSSYPSLDTISEDVYA